MSRGKPIKTLKYTMQIIELLKNVDRIHLRGIAKALGINVFTVSNIIDRYLYHFVNIERIDTFGFRAKIISLKQEYKSITMNDVLKHYELRKRIRGETTVL